MAEFLNPEPLRIEILGQSSSVPMYDREFQQIEEYVDFITKCVQACPYFNQHQGIYRMEVTRIQKNSHKRIVLLTYYTDRITSALQDLFPSN